MEKILNFTGKRLDTSDENRHSIFQEDGENSNMVGAKDLAAMNDTKDSAVKDSQQKLSEAVTTSQLKDLIKKAIKDQVYSVIQPSYTYAKPYSQKIDRLKMPGNYQPPKFQQFDGKGNSRQHIAHFVKLTIMLAPMEISWSNNLFIL